MSNPKPTRTRNDFFITLFIVAMIVILLTIPSRCHGTTLTSATPIQSPAGGLFTGKIIFQLPSMATNVSTNTVVTNQPITVRANSGSLVGSPSVVGNDVLSPQMYYVAMYYDSFGQPLGNFNYNVTGTTFDLGSAPMTPSTTANISQVNWLVNNLSASGISTSDRFNNIIYVDGVKYPITQAGVQQAFTDACSIGNPTGTTVYLPVGTTITVNNTTGQQFLITCPLHVIGPGVNALWFVYGSLVPANVPLFRVKPSSPDNGWYQFENFRVTSGSAVGGDVFFLDSTNAGVNHLRIHDVAAAGMATTSWFLNMNATIADMYFFGHLYDNQIEGGINLNSSSTTDSWLFEHNGFTASSGNINPCLNATTMIGSAHFTMFNNNGGCRGGFFISHGTTQPKILYNQIEQPSATTEVNSAIIDLIGDTYSIDGAEIIGNNINAHTFANACIRIGTATNTKISGNVMNIAPTTGVGVVLAAASSGTKIAENTNEFNGTGGGAVAMTNATGVNPFTISLPKSDGTSPARILNATDGGWMLCSNSGACWVAVNNGVLFSPPGQPLALNGGISGTGEILVPDNGGTYFIRPPDTDSVTSIKLQVASDFTLAANTSLQTITGLSTTLAANARNFSFHCALAYSQATAAVSDAFGIQVATNTPTNVFATGQVYTAAAVSTTATLATLSTSTATNIVTFTPSATATNFTAMLDGTIELPATAHTINFMVSQSNSADLLTIKRGSYCQVF